MMTGTIEIFVALAVLCGSSTASGDSFLNRIVGGSNVTDDQTYPFMVSLRSISSDRHSCGGSIVSKRTILTAAHCLYRTNASETVVVAGTNYWNSGGTRYQAMALVPHPNYSELDISNDIGLVIVNRNIEFTSRVQPVLYGPETPVGNGINAMVLGWGSTAPLGGLSPVLKYLNTKSMTNQECKSVVGSYEEYVYNSTLCVISEVGQSPCNSDSGGPIIVNNTVVGLISWGLGCAGGLPTVSTRLSSYYEWLNTIIV